MGGETEVLGGGEGFLHLIHGPFGAGLGVAADSRRGKTIELAVIGRVDGDELALQVGRKLGDLQSCVRCHTFYFIAVGL